jgi:hypothetical protein
MGLCARTRAEADVLAMNMWLTTAKLVPALGLIPLGAAVAASFMQREPAKIRVRSTGEDDRKRSRSRDW